MALTDKLSAIADAIRGKTGGTEKLTLAEMPLAIAGIEAGGGGGNANVYSGEMVMDSDTSVSAQGMTLDLGLPSRAKWFFMWFDRDDFLAIEKPSNNRFYSILMLPVTTSSLPPIRASASAAAPDTSDRFFLMGSFVNTTVSDSGYGISGLSTHVTHYTDVWSANEDGTITISRYSTAGPQFYAGTYHWIAVC